MQGGLIRIVEGTGPDLRCELGLAAAPRGVEDEGGLPLVQQHPAAGRFSGASRDRGRRPDDLAMRRVAEIEAFAAMTIAIGQREGSSGDRERLLRRIAGRGCPSPASTCAM